MRRVTMLGYVHRRHAERISLDLKRILAAQE
jgi:hypothetical protein